MATAAHTLRATPAQTVPGSGVRIVHISREDAKELRHQVVNRASRNALQIALDSGADPVYLFVEDRQRILDELTAPTPEALRRVGAL